MSTLDKEFLSELQAKINEAGRLLNEVSASLEEKGEQFLELTQDYEYDEDNEDAEPVPTLNFDPIIVALDNGGWSTSSMSC